MKKSLRMAILLLLLVCLAPGSGLAETGGTPTVALTAQKTQVITGENCVLHCFAPGAEEAILFRTDKYAANVEDTHWGANVDSNAVGISDEEMTVVYRLSARFGSRWVDSPSLTITVTAPYGPLPDPALRFSSPYKLGQDVRFTLDTVENAVMYGMTVRDEAGREVAQFSTMQPAYTIPASRLTNGVYRVEAFVRADGYSGSKTVRGEFSVGATGRTISLKAEKDAYLTNESFALSLSAPGADEAVLFRQGSEWKTWQGGVTETIWDVCRDETALWYRLRARYGDEWVETPEVKLLITAPNGSQPPLSLRLNAVYPEGRDIALSFEPVKDVAEFGLKVYGPKGEVVYETSKWQQSFTLPAAKWARGYYHLNAYLFAKGYLFDSMVDLNFHVGEIDRTVSLRLDREQALVGEEFGLRCYAPDANEAVLYDVMEETGALYEMKRWSGAVDDTVTLPPFFSTDVVKGYLFSARFGDEWKEAALIVQPAAPYGPMPAPALAVQAQYAADQEIVIPIGTNVQTKITECYVNILDSAGQWLRGIEFLDSDRRSYRIPAGNLPQGRYQIEVSAWAVGYSGEGRNTVEFQVGQFDATPRLEAIPAQPLTGSGYNVHIYAPFADEIVLYRRDGDGQEYRFYDWNTGLDRMEGAIAFGDAVSVYRLRARYGSEWKETALTVRMLSPYGNMPAPQITAQEKYPQGETVHFSVQTQEETVQLRLSVYNEQGETVYFTDYLPERDFYLSPEALPAGAYTIRAEAEALGYAGTGCAEKTFRVVRPGQEDAPSCTLKDLAYNGKAVSGRLAAGGSPVAAAEAEVRVTFYITGNYYMGTVAELNEDLSFEVEGVGPIEYITVLALKNEAGGAQTRLDAAELYTHP